MKKAFIILILSIVSFTSCDNYKEIKNEEVISAFILNSSSTFKGYYYEGSDKSYHYFKGKWDLMRDNNFTLTVGKLRIEDKYKFKHGDSVLRIDLFKENNDLFAQNEFYDLYVIKPDDL